MGEGILLRVSRGNYLVDDFNVPGAEPGHVIVSRERSEKSISAEDYVVEIGTAQSGGTVCQLIDQRAGKAEFVTMRGFNSRP